MLWFIFAVFFILWIIGLAGVYSIGGWIWLFFAIWVAALIAQFSMGRRVTRPPAAP
jgi:hypothetical protein